MPGCCWHSYAHREKEKNEWRRKSRQTFSYLHWKSILPLAIVIEEFVYDDEDEAFDWHRAKDGKKKKKMENKSMLNFLFSSFCAAAEEIQYKFAFTEDCAESAVCKFNKSSGN
jgi:hypothetical protein